jgi:predicted transcriptional regulator
MNLKDIQEILQADVLCGNSFLDREVKTGFGCDLMSEMLAFASPHTLLITSLINPHVIHTAEIMDAVGVVFVGGKRPPEEVINYARQRNIPLLLTSFLMFKSCGLLFAGGIEERIRGSR